MREPGINVLLIEDDPVEADRIEQILRDVKEPTLRVARAAHLDDGLDRVAGDGIDVVLLDLGLREDGGLEGVDLFQLEHPDIPVIALSPANEERLAFQAMHAGAQDYLDKSELNPNRVARTVRYAIERHRTQSALRSVSLVDERTGLYNRAGFLVLAQHQLRCAQRAQQNALVLSADIDGMREIYQSFGPHASYAALITVGKVLRDIFRDSDIVARVGRDEFAIMAVDVSEEHMERLSDRVNEQLSARNLHTDYQLSLSYGVAVFDPIKPQSAEELLARAMQSTHKRRSMPRRSEAGGQSPESRVE